jgi:hypothetical protein
MTYFKSATDASDLYRPSAAAASTDRYSTAVTGNLSDMMRNATIFRATFIAPVVVHINNPVPETNARDTYSVAPI